MFHPQCQSLKILGSATATIYSVIWRFKKVESLALKLCGDKISAEFFVFNNTINSSVHSIISSNSSSSGKKDNLFLYLQSSAQN
ncbi:hypothetical protein ABE24_08345 [Cytobacillus firmus]|nr:hypothetical protein [Cytobacillus firmus]